MIVIYNIQSDLIYNNQKPLKLAFKNYKTLKRFSILSHVNF